jgi:phosphoribosylformylglycinamidine synthase
MKVNWKNNEAEHTVTSPMTLNISSFSNVQDLHKSVTPELSNSDSTLLHLWAHSDKYRLGGSALYQSFKLYGGATPDIDDVDLFKAMFEASQELLDRNLIEAMHDISDGGLITSLIEMALCSNQGLSINLDYSDKEQIVPKLFSEEAGLVIEVNNEKLETVKKYLAERDLFFEEVAKKNEDKKVNINCFLTNGAK